ncbi:MULTISPECIES: FecR domain-containing protein [Pseudomonas]|uniref:Amino acid ABC transporter substrate-binding protein n=1 Tax=Pseudomonas putida TaxID=303 RepID=A0A1L7NBB2_PSEPU|nr:MULTISPECIES: FecR domain-containing protein [Pseudomonas]AGN78736.1 amino acid ABC transporter substrate-binding protein [Pseudomonas putida H8234]EKT4563242.1 FecR domain-containing protein [Pseudomonas putida]MBP2083961.1 transmembrane sensor [Pseudomonas sp. PvP089]MBP2090337.1 transmembrane sensor [Pseudomonas sp. PvP088]MBP2223499.1 transmembrane sensor [Pseudomonas putida]
MAAEPLDRDTLEAAARWYVELRCGADDTLRAAHQRWLSSNPQHLLAWERLARLQGKLAQVTPGIARPTLTSARAKRREVLKVLSVLLVGSATGGVVLQDGIVARLTADVRTGVGQQRSLRLDDGTQLRLNTDTAVDIRYNGEWRALELLKGEILVQTASDALSRPFVVHTGQGSVRALGTRFIVRCDNDLVRVCVLQHAVEVRSALAMASVRVEAGQQLEFSAGKTGNVTPLAAMADAWSREMLIVDDWRLADVVSELQRYRPGYLGCDEAVGGLRLSGAFHLGDIDIVLENLTTTLPVRIRRFSRYWTRVEAA